jgi:hypothetical protein
MDPQQKFVKRRLKWIGFCAGGLVLVLVVFAVEEHERGRWKLNGHLHRLRAKGEVYSVVALEPKHPPAEQNAFADLTNIANRLEPIVIHLDDAPPPLRFAAPGKEIVAWRLNQWGRNSKITNDWSRLGPELEEARELLGLLHAAARKPAYDSGFDYRKGFLVFQLGSLALVKRPAEILEDATLYELHGGHLDAACEHLCAMVRLAADQKPEPLVICQIVREACASMAFSATWQALQAPGWNEAQLAALQAAWEGGDFARDMGLAMEMERAMTFDFFEQLKSSKAKLAFALEQRGYRGDVFGGSFAPLLAHGFMLQWVQGPSWRIAWADQDELRALVRWQVMIERQRSARTNSWAALSSKSGSEDDLDLFFAAFMPDAVQMSWYDRLRFVFSSDAFSIKDAVIRGAICAQVQQQMAATAIAIQRFRLQTGELPADLAALVPKYLSALPRDGMDGKTLRYRLPPEGGFVLYSVGLDGKDDGRDSTPVTDKRNYYQIWDGRDTVWPPAATDEEALAAMKSAKD